MNPASNTESYPAFAHIGLRENPEKPQLGNLPQLGIEPGPPGFAARRTNRYSTGQEPMVGLCEGGNELAGSLKATNGAWPTMVLNPSIARIFQTYQLTYELAFKEPGAAVHCRPHISPPLVPILSKINPSLAWSGREFQRCGIDMLEDDE
ncbi:hypothetical protein ANN_15694 [Periplaneta americana]|uniref:Uncharacterized protein n=1 Tax=Periplaneta americana TaxID=6978 RepID=A0ABQ8SIA5_PERAM|nr:hypothetical protein ANN_15694 [Periplaneta americana]